MFEVGKKVICIKEHSSGVIKKGDLFELLGMKKHKCKCGVLVLDVGIETTSPFERCSDCGDIRLALNENEHWFRAKLFAPYDDSLSEITVEELIGELGIVREVNEILGN